MLAQSSSSSSTPPLSLPERIQQLKKNFKDWQTKSSDYRLKHSEHSPLSQIMNDTGLCDFFPTHENNLLNQILDDEINLELASDQGMSQPLLLALILLEEGRSRFSPELIAQITQEGLNQIVTSGEYAGYSSLYLLTRNPEGRTLLGNHPELIATITKEGLNQIVTSGEDTGHSPLYWLTDTPKGLSLLDKHPAKLIAQITEAGLNQLVPSGEFKGESPLYRLTAIAEGLSLLDKHPELIDKITKEGLNQIVTSGEEAGYSPLFLLTSTVKGLSLLDKHPKLIATITKEGFNQVIQSGAYAGHSPLFLLSSTAKGSSLLDKHTELIAQITQEGLNQIVQSGEQAGYSPLFWLTRNSKGQAILDKHPKLIAQITQEGFNQVIQSGEEAGYSPLFWLSSTAKGSSLLDKHPELIAQITQEGLNQIVTSGAYAGKSPLFWLTATVKGLSLLDKHPELIAQITQESFNQVIQSGEYAGTYPLYWLTRNSKGLSLLDKHPKLIAQITQEGFNQVIQSGEQAGYSPLYWLTRDSKGLSLLNKHPKLIAQITQESLNQIVTSGEEAGYSPLYWLTRNPEGTSLLAKHPELIAQITQEGLNQVIQSGEEAGLSPLLLLTGTPEGRAILGKHPKLITQITQESLNQVIASGKQAGYSPLFWLARNSEGLSLLDKHPELIAQITQESLNQVIQSGACTGSSPLYGLTSNPKGLSLLDKHPKLIAQITQESLNQVIPSGEQAGISPLFWLTACLEGRVILGNHPELVAKITKEGLNWVIQSGEYAGLSPLYWLTATSERLSLLHKHPKLIAQITQKGLNQVIQSGEQAGYSPLYGLTAHPEGRVILGKHLELIAKITSEAAKLQVFEAFQQHPNEEYSGYGLAYCHEKGVGCPLDKDQALLLYLKAADEEILAAKLACARLYEEKAQFDKAWAFYQAFIQDKKFSDFSSAQRAQVLWMTLKLKMDAHIEASIYRLFKASVPTDPQGWLGLGQCSLYGIGTAANFNQAKRYFQTASRYEATNGQAHKYLEVLNQHNNIAKYYCDELADKFSGLGIEAVGSPNDGFYQFRLSADFMNQLVGTADKAKIGQLRMDQAALLRLSGILLPSQGWQAYPSFIAVFKKAYSTQQRNLKTEAVMALKNSRLEIAERFAKAYEELSKLLRDNAPPIYQAWNEANQINHDLSSGAGNSLALKKNPGFFHFFTSLKNKFRDHEQALAGNRDQYLDHYLAFHQRYIKRDNLSKAIAAYQADDFENGDLLLDKASGQALLAEMNQALENVQKMISELKPSLDGFQNKHKDFERFAGHYRYQRPVDTSGNLSEKVTIPAYLEYIQAAELEYARFEAANKAFPPALEEKQQQVESEESPEPFEAISLASQAEPLLYPDEKLRALVQSPEIKISASSAASSSGLYYFSHQNYAQKAFEGRLDFSELSRCLKTLQDAKEDETRALTYALLYEVCDVMERLKNLNAPEFCRSHASQLRNVLYHGKKLAQIKQPHLYLNQYRELSQKLVAYLARVPLSLTQVFDAEKLMTEIPSDLFNTLLNYSSEEPINSEAIIELITGLNEQESLIQNSQLTEEYQAKACKFIIGRKGALLSDLEYQFPQAYRLYFAGNVSVKTERELGKEFRHGLEY